MARHGEDKTLKRLSAPKRVAVPRKDNVWLVKPSAGPHPASEGMAILVALRDYLGVVRDSREGKKILKMGEILVDGRKVGDYKFPVGFMDVIEIPKLGKKFLVIFDNRGYLRLEETDRDYKLCKVKRKVTVAGGKTQITLHDGRTMLVDPGLCKVGDTLKVSLKDRKVLEVYPLKEGAEVFIVRGTHTGAKGKVKAIIPGTSNSEALVDVEGDDGVFRTLKDYVFVMGG